MSRATILVGITAGVVGGVVGGSVDLVAGAAVGGILGAGGTAVTTMRDRGRLDRLAAQLEQWTDDPESPGSVVVRGDGPWRRLGAALNRVGRQFADQRSHLDRERPWRHDLVDSLVSAALVFDDAGRLVAASRAAREMLGVVADGPARTVIQALGSAVLADAVARAHGEVGHVEVDSVIGERQVRASITSVGDETLVIIHDRTQERRVEEIRRNFVVNASHELKTPATAIHTLSEALEITVERDPARVPDLVARLREEAERLVRLVHDLLNLRRLEERVDVDGVMMDLTALVHDVIEEMEERAGARQITLHVSAPDRAQMSGDPGDVRLVIRNLVANAIQYNRDGGKVEVRVDRLDDATWGIEVADTGIGIPHQDIQQIFERFYRVDVARSRQTGGTGLGLSIVRHAVERHRGAVRVESLLGEGSTFSVTLPVRGTTEPGGRPA